MSNEKPPNNRYIALIVATKDVAECFWIEELIAGLYLCLNVETPDLLRPHVANSWSGGEPLVEVCEWRIRCPPQRQPSLH